MITMAKFQTQAKMFAGLLIPYRIKGAKAGIRHGKIAAEASKAPKAVKTEKIKVKSAILGGGDIGFPLLFAGVVMKGLMLKNPVFIGFLKTLIIPLFVSITLLLLLIKSKEDRYYPAMPFLSIGCLLGYLAVLMIG